MTNETKQLVLQTLKNNIGDDLYRAQLAFKGLSEEEMNTLYGMSGKTRQELINEYQKWEDKFNKAIKEIESM